MSTRSMTIIAQPYSGKADDYIALYRHCDGYPSEAGASLALAILDNPPDTETIVRRLLDPSHGEYRLATWMPEDQGDLEHVYEVNAGPGVVGGKPEGSPRSWTVKHYCRANWQQDDYDHWPAITYSAAEFVSFVNQRRQEINADLKARNPNATPYEMIGPA